MMSKLHQRLVIAASLVLVAVLAWACVPMGQRDDDATPTTLDLIDHEDTTPQDDYVAYARTGPMRERYRDEDLIDVGYEYCDLMVAVEDHPDLALQELQRRSYDREDLAENAWLLDAAVIHLCPEHDAWRNTRG